MGNTGSTKKKQENMVLPQKEQQLQKVDPFAIKKILLLHKSNSEQLKVVRNFRHGLNAKANGTVRVTNFVNVADGVEIPKNLSWLNELNNVVLICLTPEAIEQFQGIIMKKGFADENGHLHEKVFTICFGEGLASLWPPKGLNRSSKDLRDFHFGFSDSEKLQPLDFEKSPRLKSLIAAIRLTN